MKKVAIVYWSGAGNTEAMANEPMFSSVQGQLSGKDIVLFGSYGWGDGGWMRDWQDRCIGFGANILGGEGLIVNETPDENGLEKCRDHGRMLAQ